MDDKSGMMTEMGWQVNEMNPDRTDTCEIGLKADLVDYGTDSQSQCSWVRCFPLKRVSNLADIPRMRNTRVCTTKWMRFRAVCRWQLNLLSAPARLGLFICCLDPLTLDSGQLLWARRIVTSLWHSDCFMEVQYRMTRSSAVAERPRDASCHLIFRQVVQGNSRSLKNGTIQKVSYSHSTMHCPILYHFRDKARSWSKTRFFSLPCIRYPR